LAVVSYPEGIAKIWARRKENGQGGMEVGRELGREGGKEGGRLVECMQTGLWRGMAVPTVVL
jgi:hypothetical protein